MGILSFLKGLREKKNTDKEMFKEMEKQVRFQKMLDDRQKSCNERELDRLMNDERENTIKEQLTYMRKQRDNDIRFGHNPLDVKNITKDTNWHVLKEKNLFGNKKNMFVGQKSIHKSGGSMSGESILKNKRMFKI